LRQKKDISGEELKRLKEKGWSTERLRIHFKVSKSTIKRRLRELAGVKQQNYMTLAMRLETIGRQAPPGFCREELNRLVSSIRTMVSDEEKKKAILASIESGAWTVVEISDECRLMREDTERLLKILVLEGSVGAREPGGVMNRGRKKKFHFYLLAT
jgi:hypothetical protein